MEEEKRRIEALVVKCDTCKMHECIGCEIVYNDIQAIKSLIKENNDLRKYRKLANKNIDNEIILREKNAPEDTYVLQSRIEELEEEVESQDKTIDNLVEEQEEREKYVHSLEEENAKLRIDNTEKLCEECSKLVKEAGITEEDTSKILKDYRDKVENSIPISVIQNKKSKLDEEDLEIYDTDSEDLRIAKYEQRAVLDFCNSLLEERNK